jgi:ankyrin repeat/SOCS box protein 13/metal transporter CNNM
MRQSAMAWEHLSPEERIYLPICCVVLVLLSALCSGLAIGTFSLNLVRLKVQARTAFEPKRSRAKRVIPLLDHSHLTLVTLLVTNTCFITVLPVLLEEIFGPLIALIISVTALLFFGDVLPQAVFVRHNLIVCAFFVPLIYFFGVVTFIIAYPLAKVLDATVGRHKASVGRPELAAYISQACHGDESHADGLAPQEVMVMQGAMLLNEKLVRDLGCTPVDEMFMLSSTDVLDRATLTSLLNRGFSRVPVCCAGRREQIIGVLLLKSLLPLMLRNAPAQPPLIATLPLNEPLRISDESPIKSLYRAFRTGKSHMAAVYDQHGLLVSFVTLDDVFALLNTCAIATDASDRDGSMVPVPRRQTQLLSAYESCREQRRSQIVAQ